MRKKTESVLSRYLSVRQNDEIWCILFKNHPDRPLFKAFWQKQQNIYKIQKRSLFSDLYYVKDAVKKQDKSHVTLPQHVCPYAQ